MDYQTKRYVPDGWKVPIFNIFVVNKLFQHKLPMDRSSMTRWRKRVGDEKLEELLIESIETAKRLGAMKEKDMERVAVDTTVQEKAVDHPSEIKLIYDAIIDLGKEAKNSGLSLKQSYKFVARDLALKASGYAHARQFNRLKRSVKSMRNLLVKLRQRIANRADKVGMREYPERLKEKLGKATKILIQNGAGADRILVWHAPEVEMIAKGKARKRLEFGCKVSLVTNVNPAKGGHFILSSQALHGRPYDGHTLLGAIENMEKNTGIEPQRIYVDKGYKGHDYAEKLRVYTSGQKRGVHGQIKRELKRRSAIEPIIGHVKHSHGLARHKLKGQLGDRINAIGAAIGFNMRQLLNFIRKSSHAFILMTIILNILPKRINQTA